MGGCPESRGVDLLSLSTIFFFGSTLGFLFLSKAPGASKVTTSPWEMGKARLALVIRRLAGTTGAGRREVVALGLGFDLVTLLELNIDFS
jgi:hypothetical protein